MLPLNLSIRGDFQCLSTPVVAFTHVKWVSGPPLKPKCLRSLYMIFAFSSAALSFRGLISLNQKAFQGVMARPISLTSAWTFKESLVGLRSGSPTRPQIKKGSSLGSSSRLVSVWKESYRRISPLHSIAEYIRGKKCSADLKRRLGAECHAAGAGSAGIAAMRGNMSE